LQLFNVTRVKTQITIDIFSQCALKLSEMLQLLDFSIPSCVRMCLAERVCGCADCNPALQLQMRQRQVVMTAGGEGADRGGDGLDARRN